MSKNNELIYNLAKYIANQLPSIPIVVNGLQKNSTDTVIEIDDGGGTGEHNYDRNDFMIYMLSRSIDKTIAKKNLMDVYNLLNDKFGLLLPEETVATIVYPTVKTWRITSTNLPISLGSDENGKNLFSTNFIITTT